MRTQFSCRRVAGYFGATLFLAQVAGCGTPRSQRTGRLDRTVITRDQMINGHYTSVYDAVVALRSSWLRPRAPDSFVLPSTVWVYVDGARIGDVSSLQSMQPRLVNTVRYYDAVAATSLWGVDHGAGVIHVSTWSEGAPGSRAPDSTRRPPKPPGARLPDSIAR